MLPSSWNTPITLPTLAPASLHVWRVRLDQDDYAPYLALLAPDEQQRAQRYLVAHARQQFVGVRVVLRVLLAAYLQRAPDALRFVYTPNGKPTLEIAEVADADDPDGRHYLHFNVAHSHEWGLLAFSRAAPVGVDVEQLRAEVATPELARRYFAPSEAATLHALPPAQQHAAFFAYWTHKEACLKAIGGTLAHGLQQFTFATRDDATLHLHHTPADQPPPAAWTVAALPLGMGYAAAVASPLPNLEIQGYNVISLPSVANLFRV